jgi:integrase
MQKLKQEANARRHQLIEADPHMTFGALAARFIANGNPSHHHLERLEMLLTYFADTPVVRINRAMAGEYRAWRHAAKQVSDATINRDLSVMRRLLYWGVEQSLLLANPLARLRMERERRTGRPVVSIVEEANLLKAAADHLKDIIVAALDTGMRRGEILHQRWEHVDFTRRLLFVTRSKTPEGEAREIPLTRRLLTLLWSRRQPEGLIFTFNQVAIRDIKTAWKRTLKNSGSRHIRFHDLRHTFNTRLLEAGVMQEVRMALMGHSNRERVHSIYTHVELPAKREAIAKLEQWVQDQKQLKGGGENAITQAV